MPGSKLTTPNLVPEGTRIKFLKVRFLGLFPVNFNFWSWTKIFSFGRKYFIFKLNLRLKNFEGRSFEVLRNVWMGLKLQYFEYVFYIYLQNISKRDKRKMNSRIKITTIKIMRFKTKVLKRAFKNLNQEVLRTLQKFAKDKNNTLYAYIFSESNK